MAQNSQMPPQWLGLLRWSLRYNDGTKSTNTKPMSDEDKEFLENVLKTMVVDEGEQLRAGITVLKLPDPPAVETKGSEGEKGTAGAAGAAADAKATDSTDVKNATPSDAKAGAAAATSGGSLLGGDSGVMSELERLDAEESSKTESLRKIEEALEMLDDVVQNGPENGINFVKMGGVEPLLKCTASAHAGIRERACHLITSIVQNNPKPQVAFLKAGALSALFKLFLKPEPKVLGKAIGAVASCVRGIPAGEELFLKAQGIPWLLRTLAQKGHSNRVLNKSLMLLTHFTALRPGTRELAAALGGVHVLARFVTADNIDVRERALEALVDLASVDKARSQIREGALAKIVSSRAVTIRNITDADDRDMHEEELELLEKLKKLTVGTS